MTVDLYPVRTHLEAPRAAMNAYLLPKSVEFSTNPEKKALIFSDVELKSELYLFGQRTAIE